MRRESCTLFHRAGGSAATEREAGGNHRAANPDQMAAHRTPYRPQPQNTPRHPAGPLRWSRKGTKAAPANTPRTRPLKYTAVARAGRWGRAERATAGSAGCMAAIPAPITRVAATNPAGLVAKPRPAPPSPTAARAAARAQPLPTRSTSQPPGRARRPMRTRGRPTTSPAKAEGRARSRVTRGSTGPRLSCGARPLRAASHARAKRCTTVGDVRPDAPTGYPSSPLARRLLLDPVWYML
jgi:hypothetical protein